MNQYTTKHGLSSALLNGTPLLNLDGVPLLTNVQSVEMESGGRKCWNVQGYYDGEEKTIFVKTVD